jgi:transposase
MGQNRYCLSEETVIAMRKRAVEGAVAKQIAFEFGVSRETARDVTTGRTYAYYGGPIQRRKYRFVGEAESRQIGLFVALGNSTYKASKIFGRSEVVCREHAEKYRKRHGLEKRVTKTTNNKQLSPEVRDKILYLRRLSIMAGDEGNEFLSDAYWNYANKMKRDAMEALDDE